MSYALICAGLLTIFLCLGGISLCAGLWHYRFAILAMLRTIATRKRLLPRLDQPQARVATRVRTVTALYTSVQQWRIKRLLTAHPTLAVNVLRQNDLLASTAIRQYLELDAKSGAPTRATYQYPTLGFMGAGGSPLQKTLPKMSPAALRQFSTYPPSRRAINALSNPILDLQWSIGLRHPVGHKMTRPLPDPTSEQQRRIVAVTDMLTRPNNEMTWRTFLEMCLEDLLVYGASPFEVEDNDSDNRPLFLWPVEAQSIRINAGWQPGSDTYHYSQARGYIWNALGTTDDIYINDDELCYPRLNPRTNTPFGLGYLEVAFDTANAFMGAFDYATRRASNNTPNFGIFLGENVTIDQTRVWQHYWENEIEGYGKVPILGGGRQPSVFSMRGTGQDELFLSWQEWLVRIIAMSFGLSPMKLGLERDVNRNTSETQASADWETIAPIANLVKDTITHWILWRRLGWTDLEFQWNIKIADELKQAEIFYQQYETNSITVDEIRQAYDRPPLPDGMGQHTKAAYEAIFKAAAGGPPDDTTLVTPFDDAVKDDTLSGQERAFVRELVRTKRHERHGLAAVAT